LIDGKDWAEVRLPFENDDQGARLLLGLGPEFRVIAPASLRKRVSKQAQATIRLQEEAV
jgi:predicted DNA-binding transcriptional regulator YafY